MKKRRSLLSTTKKSIGHFCVPLSIDFFHTPVFMCPGINLKLKILKNKDDFFLLSDGQKAKFKLIELKARFRLVETSKNYSDDSTKIALGKTNAYYPYYMSKIRSNIITSGIQSFIWPAAIRGRLPKQIILGFLDHSAYSGDYKKNPFVFRNYGINGLCLRINGVSYPTTPYKPDFSVGNYSTLYDDFLRNCGVAHHNESIGVSISSFVNHKLLWVFDLSPDNCNRRDLHLDQHGDIDVEVSFKEPTDKTITLLMYSSTFGGLMIGKDMQVELLSTDN